ncbi:ABC transporter ATP-binding protein [Actinotalea sp. K2]|uniref:ABC transporter ATP-binding protein n=1 Tax=Actinotalea sp. K2 TaxID=2939438 RepID=UPI002016F088|nr:ABC transporter ATP-binding protein [Actinotalea sp. K2]MCL3859575.1 ABC transporter ATP-binding protein [Actinotalea sp. K2]
MPSSTQDRPADPVVSVDGLHKRYGSTIAVDDVGLDVHRGEIFGILGPNGAGKTTTVECLTGLRAPDRGTVRVLGLDPQRDGLALRQRVGCQLQESELPGKLRAGEALDLYSSFYEHPADGRALAARLGLTSSLDTPYAKLSGGQKQRLSIALALIGNPEIAVLDELTTGLDPQARRDTWELIEGVRDQGVTIVLVTHFMDEAERLCDRLALIDHGRVVATDTPQGLVRRAGVGQVLRFRTADPVPDERLRAVLAQVPSVEQVDVTGDDVVVRGGHDVVVATLLGLTGQGITPVAVAAERGRLEDAFVELTRRDRQHRPGADAEPTTVLEEV